MSFYPLERLKSGKIDFLFNLTPSDRKRIIEDLRKSEEREIIVAEFLSKAIKRLPYFCLEVIYDMDKYYNETFDLLKKYKIAFDDEKIGNVINNTSFGEKYVYDNLDEILLKNEESRIDMLIDFAYNKSENKDKWLCRLSKNNNLHQRALFMISILKKHPQDLAEIYDNIIEYLTSENGFGDIQLSWFPEKISSKDLSLITYLVSKTKLDRSLYLELKEYLLTNYKENDLAEMFLKNYLISNRNFQIDSRESGMIEFKQDSNRLFKTSRNYQLRILEQYSENISKDLLEKFKYYLQFFQNENVPRYLLSEMFSKGLGSDIRRCIDIYYPKSKEQSCEFVGRGSTSSCFRIGDYVLKLSTIKWSYEDVICPNLYLIIKNEEEKFVRDDKGIVRAALEVQKHLKRTAKDLPSEHFVYFNKELNRLGYMYTDTLINGMCGDNCMLLDSYKDADCFNPESLPEMFKRVPLVLIDRDRVYPKNKIYIKQLSEGHS